MEKKATWKMSEVVEESVSEAVTEEKAATDEVPDVDMDAIMKAISTALDDNDEEPESRIIAPLPAEAPSKEATEEFLAKVAPEAVSAEKKEKAKKLSMKDLSGKKEKTTPATVDTEVKEKKPRATPTKNPKLSHYGTPIIRTAPDKCSTCVKIVKWHSTTDGEGNPIWICSECGREVPRKAPKAKAAA